MENKITTEIRYKNMSFDLSRNESGLRLYIEKIDQSYCIIVDTNDNVLFELSADCVQNVGYLEVV